MIFSVLMLFSAFGIISSVSSSINLKNLKEYDAVILYLENYKKGNQNYLLYVSNDELIKTKSDDEYKSYANFHFFRYCSDKNKCRNSDFNKIGDWYEWEMD